MLQDLVTAAVNQALRQAEELAAKKMGGGMRRHGPGNAMLEALGGLGGGLGGGWRRDARRAARRRAEPRRAPRAEEALDACTRRRSSASSPSSAKLPGIGAAHRAAAGVPHPARPTRTPTRSPTRSARSRSASACARSASTSPTGRAAGSARTSAATPTVICVVEEPGDVIPIERTHEFRGRYHVLGGALSPIDGVDPEDLKIAELYTRVEADGVDARSCIATNPTTTGEATALHIADGLRERSPEVTVTRLASGLPVGGRPRVRRRGHARPGVRGPPRACDRSARDPRGAVGPARLRDERRRPAVSTPAGCPRPSYLVPRALLVGLVDRAVGDPGAARASPADRHPRGAGVHARIAARAPTCTSDASRSAAADCVGSPWRVVTPPSERRGLSASALRHRCSRGATSLDRLDRGARHGRRRGRRRIVGHGGATLRARRPARRVHRSTCGVLASSSVATPVLMAHRVSPGHHAGTPDDGDGHARRAPRAAGSCGGPRAGRGILVARLTRLPAGSLRRARCSLGRRRRPPAARRLRGAATCCARWPFARHRPAGRPARSRCRPVRERRRAARAGPALHRRAHGRLLRARGRARPDDLGDAPGRLPGDHARRRSTRSLAAAVAAPAADSDVRCSAVPTLRRARHGAARAVGVRSRRARAASGAAEPRRPTKSTAPP